MTASPDEARALTALGIALARRGDSAQAVEALIRAVEMDQTNGATYVGLSLALADSDQVDEVAPRLLAIAPEEPICQLYLAHFFRGLGRLGDAQQAAWRAVTFGDGSSTYAFCLAEILFLAGEFDSGLASLRDALEALRPEDPSLDARSLCELLWERFEGEDSLPPELFASLVDSYRAADALEHLGQGLVSTIPDFAVGSVDLEKAEAWVDAWLSTSTSSRLQAPFAMLRAGLEWRRENDPSHLLALPQRHREILTDIAAMEEDEEGGND